MEFLVDYYENFKKNDETFKMEEIYNHLKELNDLLSENDKDSNLDLFREIELDDEFLDKIFLEVLLIKEQYMNFLNQ